jgi:uncharacterized membrane protein
MSTVTTSTVSSYARAVREALADLPPEQARGLLDGLDEHLAEIGAEGNADMESMLGSPSAYAAELRSSAGLPAAVTVKPTSVWAAPPTPPAPPVSNRTADEPNRASPPPTMRDPQTRLDRGIFTAIAFFVILMVAVGATDLALATLVAASTWFVVNAIAKRVQLPAHVATRLPLAIAVVAAALTSILIAGRLNGTNTVYITQDQPQLATTAATPFPTVPGGGQLAPEGMVMVPNVLAMTAPDARRLLNDVGLEPNVVAATSSDVPQVVIGQEPAVGAVVPRGSRIMVIATTDRSPQSPATTALTTAPTASQSTTVTSAAAQTTAPAAVVVAPSAAP